MSKYKFRRQIIAAGGIDSTGGCEFDAASTFNGIVTFAVSPVFTAGVDAIGTLATPPSPTLGMRLAASIQQLDDSDSLSDASTGGTAVTGYGITCITVTGTTGSSTAGSTHNDLVFKLSRPAYVGITKDIFITGSSASTKVVSVRTANSSETFFGSTRNSIAFTTTVNDLGVAWAVQLRGITTKQWAVMASGKMSTAAAFAGATA